MHVILIRTIVLVAREAKIFLQTGLSSYIHSACNSSFTQLVNSLWAAESFSDHVSRCFSVLVGHIVKHLILGNDKEGVYVANTTSTCGGT